MTGEVHLQWKKQLKNGAIRVICRKCFFLNFVTSFKNDIL